MAEQRKKKVLVTGVSRFLGLRIAKRLEDDPDVESIIGVDTEEPPIPIKNLEFVRVDIGNPLIARVLQASEVDTLIHTNISSTPSVLGGRSQMKENNVIGTMQLLAAAQRAQSIKKVIVKSSSAVYGSGPAEPSILPEDHASRHVELSGYGKDCAEAETFARDFGRRREDVDLVILRTQNVIGPTVATNITTYLSLPVLPTALGYDPRLQFIHEEDAVDAFAKAMSADCRGIYNIAADGVVYLSQAIRLLGKIQAPILLPAAQAIAALMKRFDIVDFPPDQLKLILFGRVVDIQRARAAFGFDPKFSTLDALLDFRDNRRDDLAPGPSPRPSWERELFDYLKQKSQGAKETV
jgi:UDP-glucose 4-epimerase